MAPELRSEGGAELNSMERGGNSMGNSVHGQPCGGRSLMDIREHVKAGEVERGWGSDQTG